MQKYLPTTHFRLRCFILISLVIFIYVITNSPLPTLVGSGTFNYRIKPCMWLGLALIAWLFPRVHSKSLIKFKSSINMWAMTFALVFVVISVLAGFIDGLGKSPYSHTPKGMLINFF